MKLKLEEKYGNCRKLYTEGKTEFILKVIGLEKKYPATHTENCPAINRFCHFFLEISNK